MPDIPANFFTRSELQALILKAETLRKQVKCVEQEAALLQLLIGASLLEGLLAELTTSAHPVNRALDNPNGWEVVWFDSSYKCDKTVIGYGQQVLKIPGNMKAFLATGRMKLTIAGETYVSCDRAKLHAQLVRHLEPMSELPDDQKQFLITTMFSAPTIVNGVPTSSECAFGRTSDMCSGARPEVIPSA
jgi:hypothetical protein